MATPVAGVAADPCLTLHEHELPEPRIEKEEPSPRGRRSPPVSPGLGSHLLREPDLLGEFLGELRLSSEASGGVLPSSSPLLRFAPILRGRGA